MKTRMRKCLKKHQRSHLKWDLKRPKEPPRGPSKNKGEAQGRSEEVPWAMRTISGGFQELKNTVFYNVFERVTKIIEN